MSEKHHGYFLTINYYDEKDVEEVGSFVSTSDYYIIGFEGCDNHHAHMHVSVHFKSDRRLSAVKNHFTKKHHIRFTKDYLSLHKYCMGYRKDDTIKCSGCSIDTEYIVDGRGDTPRPVNVYMTEGVIPENGKHKSQPKSEKVIEAIQSGKSLEELRQLFPSFMMYHESKVKRWIEVNKKKPEKIQFSKISIECDNVMDIIEFRLGSDRKYSFVTELSQLQMYDEYDVIVYQPEAGYDSKMSLWESGQLFVSYKFGYEYKRVQPIYMVIVLPKHELKYLKCEEVVY